MSELQLGMYLVMAFSIGAVAVSLSPSLIRTSFSKSMKDTLKRPRVMERLRLILGIILMCLGVSLNTAWFVLRIIDRRYLLNIDMIPDTNKYVSLFLVGASVIGSCMLIRAFTVSLKGERCWITWGSLMAIFYSLVIILASGEV